MQIHFCRVIYTHSNEEILLEDVLYMIVNPQSAAKRNNIAGCLVLNRAEKEKTRQKSSLIINMTDTLTTTALGESS